MIQAKTRNIYEKGYSHLHWTFNEINFVLIVNWLQFMPFFHIANFQRSAPNRTQGWALFYFWHFALNKNGSLDRKPLPYLNLQIAVFGVRCLAFSIHLKPPSYQTEFQWKMIFKRNGAPFFSIFFVCIFYLVSCCISCVSNSFRHFEAALDSSFQACRL